MIINCRLLTIDDYETVQKLDSGIEDDYVVRIFKALTTSDEHKLYGCFDHGKLVTYGGYSIFADSFAVLGRIRTDVNERSKGYGKALMDFTIKQIKKDKTIKWLGAATKYENTPARKVLENLGIDFISSYYSCIVDPNKLKKVSKDSLSKWNIIRNPNSIRSSLLKLNKRNLKMFSYECYYTLPFEEHLLSDDYLNDSFLYQKEDEYFFVTRDEKGEAYLQIRYFGNFDVFSNNTVWNELIIICQKENRKLWMDIDDQVFSYKHQQFLESKEHWCLYGTYL